MSQPPDRIWGQLTDAMKQQIRQDITAVLQEFFREHLALLKP